MTEKKCLNKLLITLQYVKENCWNEKDFLKKIIVEEDEEENHKKEIQIKHST
jgi:hypothetical protein